MSLKIEIDILDVINRIKLGETLLSIANRYNISTVTLNTKLKLAGITDYRLLKFNHNYFEYIDTEAKAYWLGFLMADGCLSEYNHPAPIVGSVKKLILSINSIDYNHLVKFNKALDGCQNIFKTHDNCVRIQFNSCKMFDDLTKLGCTARKSHTLKFPNIDEKFIKHFIRGYIDGDGCISFKDKNNKIWSIVLSYIGTLDMMQALNKYFGVHNKMRRNGINTYSTAICGNVKAMRILDWLYHDATIFLDRKYKLYSEHKEKLERNGF